MALVIKKVQKLAVYKGNQNIIVRRIMYDKNDCKKLLVSQEWAYFENYLFYFETKKARTQCKMLGYALL